MPTRTPGTGVRNHTLLPNGMWQHSVSQSDLKQFSHCPEQHRRHLLNLDKPMQNDAALLGSVFALYPQSRLKGISTRDAAATCLHLLEHGSESLRYPLYGWHSEYLNQVTFRDFSEAASILIQAFAVCEVELAKLPQGTLAEVEFDELLYADNQRAIRINGAVDLWLRDGAIQDWKLSGQDYVGRDSWKFQRYDPQPAQYVLGRMLKEQLDYSQMPGNFTFINIHRSKMAVQSLPLDISEGDLRFHIERVEALCKFIEKNGFTDKWPLNPSDWWCSNKWCPAWKDCRGKHIGEDPWQLIAKSDAKLGL